GLARGDSPFGRGCAVPGTSTRVCRRKGPPCCLYGNSAEAAAAVRGRSRRPRISAIVEDGFRLLPSLLVNVPYKQEGPRLDAPVEGERRSTFAEDMENALRALVVGHGIGVIWVRLDGEFHPLGDKQP